MPKAVITGVARAMARTTASTRARAIHRVTFTVCPVDKEIDVSFWSGIAFTSRNDARAAKKLHEYPKVGCSSCGRIGR